MKKNVPKFVLAKNELAAPGATYLIHTQEPSFIAEIKRFPSLIEREEYLSENSDKEIIEVNQLVVIEIKRYLTSPDVESIKEGLSKRMKDWVISNYLVKNALEPI